MRNKDQVFYINREYPKHQAVEMFVHYPSGHKKHLYNLQKLEWLQKVWLTETLHKYPGFWG